MSQTQIILVGISVVTAALSGYCFGRAREIKSKNAHADYWYDAYQEVFKRLK